nr:hypothetical protein [Tanacetum cinerariifolium]GEX69392.1 hypothetical protein [Tanacetum cinerariifolium]
MYGWKPKALKTKSFAKIHKLFDQAFKRVNTFVDIDTDAVKDIAKGSEIRVEESSKRAGEDLQQESTKKQKVDDDQEAAELKRMRCDGEIDDILRIRLHEAGSNEEIFTYVAWIRVFNINEPIYTKLCHEFYSTYEFDEVCADDELQTKKIIKYRLGGRAHSLCSDEHFDAQEYWLSISREENLSLSRSHTSTIRRPVLRVIHKIITYRLCQRTTGYDKIHKNDMWLLSVFDARHQNRDLDTTTLKEFIDSKGRLIPNDPQSGVPRVGILRPPRASMQDLYDRMGSMEIRQEAIESMEENQDLFRGGISALGIGSLCVDDIGSGSGDGDGDTNGGGSGKGDLDLLRDKDGKSDGDDKDDDGKSDGGEDDDGNSDGSNRYHVDNGAALH